MLGAMGAISMAFLSVGCLSFGNKNKKEVAADLPAPPPAAYPDTSSNLSGGSSTPAAAPVAGSPSSLPTVPTASSPAVAAPAPQPFSLREGEQLVPHLIQTGENLSSIAARYNTSVARIQAANGMTDTRIFAGKTIQVPTLSLSGGSSAPQGSTPPAVGLAPSSLSAPGATTYPSIVTPPASTPTAPAAPTAPVAPAAPSSPGAIAAPPIPSSAQSSVSQPIDPASTSYPRTSPAPSTSSSAFPTPSFQQSRIQFSN